MGKDKLMRFEAIKGFDNVTEFHYNAENKIPVWSDWFGNTHPIVLELGCGKGEYTGGLAKRYPEKNFIGVDLKGNRIYIGARDAISKRLGNVHFLRTRIDFIAECFTPNSIDEIWLTFSDPQPKKPRKRLSSRLFIQRYARFLKPNGKIHIKTDSDLLFEFSLEQIEIYKYPLIFKSWDIYNDIDQLPPSLKEDLLIKTHYEKLFSAKGATIKYCQFSLPESL